MSPSVWQNFKAESFGFLAGLTVERLGGGLFLLKLSSSWCGCLP